MFFSVRVWLPRKFGKIRRKINCLFAFTLTSFVELNNRRHMKTVFILYTIIVVNPGDFLIYISIFYVLCGCIAVKIYCFLFVSEPSDMNFG